LERVIVDRSQPSVEQSSSTTCAKCDKLPISFGHHYWDYNKASYQAIHVPPHDTGSNTRQDICGPRILFAGAIECGGEVLPPLLAHHPRIKLNLCPDSRLENCDVKHFQGDYNNYTNTVATVWGNNGLSYGYMSDPINYISRYTQKLPFIQEDDRYMTIDISPTYIQTETFPNIAQRTNKLLPNAKIVFNICDPAHRMYSEYENSWNHQSFAESFYHNHGVRVPNNFNEYVEDMDVESINCQENEQFCSELLRDRLNTGRYVDRIRHWQDYYGSENVLVLNMEDNNEHNLKRIFKLMGDCLPDTEYPWQSVFPANEKQPTEKRPNDNRYKEAFDWLYDYFRDSNKALANEINETFPLEWNQ
jgi:hypothetical protein